MIDPDNYDCTRCGACCVSDFDAVDYVHISTEDAEPLYADDLEHLIYVERKFGAQQLSMKTAYDSRGNCRCIALDGKVGEEVSCSIYDIRPSVCRKFQPGTDVCDYARQLAFGLSPK